MSAFEQLRHRKLVQWALAYLAGGWLVAEVFEHLADTWGLSSALVQGLHVVLAVGFVATLVLAWYHGEQGRQRVSGPELLMLAGIFLVGGVAVTALGRDPDPEAAEARLPETAPDGAPVATTASPRSVAVLPLENHSADAEYAYFADAMSSEISTALAAVPALEVKSYTNSRRFEDFGMAPREFAAELGVAHLLEGSVQREADRIRITVRLVDARTGEESWTEVYEKRGVIEAIDAQIDIARQVAEQLAAEFSEREFERLEAGATDDPVAYDAYLRARRYDWTAPEELDVAREELRQALRRDPSYAIAWAAYGGTSDWKRRLTGDAQWGDSTLQAYRRAAEAGKGTPLENGMQGIVALLEGRADEAISLMREEALAHPGSAMALQNLTGTFYLVGDYAEAVRWARGYLDLHPLDHTIWAVLGDMYSKLGMDRRATAAFERASELSERSANLDWVPYAYRLDHAVRVGDVEQARTLADSIRLRRDRSLPWVQGYLAILEGDLEGARAIYRSIDSDSLGPRELPYFAWAEKRLGDTVAARRTLESAREKTASASAIAEDLLPRLVTAAVDDDPENVATALAEYVDAGGRDARRIRRDPVFDRVRDEPVFEAEFERLEELLDRQRRQVERDLAGEK